LDELKELSTMLKKNISTEQSYFFDHSNQIPKIVEKKRIKLK
jgi:hypothetical protein